MALQKSIDTQFGIPATYWKVVKTDFDYLNKSGTIILCGYISEQARQEQKRHTAVRNYKLISEKFDTYFTPSAINPQDMNQVKNSYLYIKELENSEFLDAIDV
jgi:NADPH-dependent curcumin reductase CurA